MFKMVERAGLRWLECTSFARRPWVVHAFSTRQGGKSDEPATGLNLGFTERDNRASVKRNRDQFIRSLRAEMFILAELRQIHSTNVYQVARSVRDGLEFLPCGIKAPRELRGRLPQGDVLLTDRPGILLSVRVADCLPVLLLDPHERAVAAVHAGWRGLLGRVAEKAVGEMVRLFGSRPKELLAALGPSIRACCYPVGPEVVDAFCGSFQHGEKYFQTQPGKENGTSSAAHLDLAEVARDQLRSAGLTLRHIETAEFCTACRTDLFYSYRKEGSSTGRMMAVIGIRVGD